MKEPTGGERGQHPAQKRSFLRDNGLGLAFGIGFLLTLVGQAVAGHAEFNSQLVDEAWPVWTSAVM